MIDSLTNVGHGPCPCAWCNARRMERELERLDAKYHDHLPEGANCQLCGVEHAAINPQSMGVNR